MRWVFFCVLILNVVYLVWSLAARVVPAPVAPTPMAAASGGQLTLLSEVGVTSVSGGDELAAPVPATDMCVTLGPWVTRAGAQEQLKALRAKGYSGQVSQVQVSRDRLHWVYLPPAESRTAALKVLRDLQGKDVDSFIVAEGEDQNAISLGYFSSAESARGLSVKMKTAGYPAETRETERVELEYWLFFSASSVPDEGAALRAAIAADSTLSGNNVSCRSQAPVLSNSPDNDSDQVKE